jgi:hypothetical protein
MKESVTPTFIFSGTLFKKECRFLGQQGAITRKMAALMRDYCSVISLIYLSKLNAGKNVYDQFLLFYIFTVCET